MPGNKSFMFLMMLILLGNAWSTAHAERQSLMSIAFQAESFLEDYSFDTPYPAQFQLPKLDNRLNLKPCGLPLEIEFTHSKKVIGNTSLTVQCKTPVNWQIRLPVRVTIFDDVVVNKIPLMKGQTIDSHSIEYSKQDITRLQRGFFRRTQPLDNLQAKRNLPAKTILNTTNLSLRQLVKSGQQVSIIVNVDGLQITSRGLALQSASLGEVIKVRNTKSNRIVEGVVSAAGQITVRL